MDKKFLGLALVLVIALGAGCESTKNNTTATSEEAGDTQGIAVGEPNPNAPAQDEKEPGEQEDTPTDDGAAEDETPSEGEESEAGVKVFTVEGTSFAFSPSVMKVKKGDTVRVIFDNKAGFHDWVLDEFDAQTKQISAGATDTIEFVADKAGEFEYYCSVGSHRQMGMVGTLIVEE